MKKSIIIIAIIIIILMNGFLKVVLPIISDKPESVDEPIEVSEIIKEPVKKNIIPANSLFVEDFDAIGDGIVDDTDAIQEAIDEAINLGRPLVFEQDKIYKISGTLLIKSNLHISGYGSILYMPSQRWLVNMMITEEEEIVENVTIEGLSFMSKNDRKGTEYAEGSLTSNVTALHFIGINNLKIKDVYIYEMNVGIKFGESSNNQINENIAIDNTHIYRSLTPLLMNTTKDFTMTKGTLDASAGSSRFLHSVYIDMNTSNITFDQVLFENSPGAGVHIYNGYKGTSPATNINIIDSRIQDSRVGIIIFSGANNISVSNVEITRVDLAFSVDHAENVNINNVTITEPTALTDVPKGAFRIKNMYQSSIKNVTIDGYGMEGVLISIHENLVDLLISDMTVKNINDLHLFQADDSSNVENLVVENSMFEFSKVSTERMRFRGAGSTALFYNNTFINTNGVYSSLINNDINTSISLIKNKYSGFTNLVSTTDASILKENTNLNKE